MLHSRLRAYILFGAKGLGFRALSWGKWVGELKKSGKGCHLRLVWGWDMN